MELAELPHVVLEAWEALGDPRVIVGAEETSPGVSTNDVYRLDLVRGSEPGAARAPSVFAKISSYGSYVHFRQDHARVARFGQLLRGTRYQSFLAPVLEKAGSVFTYESQGTWVVFYGEIARRGVTPRVLGSDDIRIMGAEIARFHLASDAVHGELPPTWKTVGSDIASLYDQLGEKAWRTERGFSNGEALFLKAQCDAFLENAERLGYHAFHHIPVLIDWNRGNFSVEHDEEGGFSLFSRWDYDWFRIEPRMLDFYFLGRLVRAEGDQSTFSYLPDPLFEPRFAGFLRAYHAVFPLSEPEVLFLKEAYRFFVLNYVIRVGEHFFVPPIYSRLAREAVHHYLPALERQDFRQLLAALE